MSDGFKPVSRGERLNLRAATQNQVLKTVQQARLNQAKIGGGAVSFAGRETQTQILVKNDSGSNVNQFGVLGVTATLVEPADSESTWRERRALIGDTPAATDPFVIVQEPIADGSIGAAVILGVTPAILNVVDEGHAYCGPTNDETAELTSSTGGPARILWKESGEGEGKKAVVLLFGAPNSQRIRIPTCIAFRTSGSSGG